MLLEDLNPQYYYHGTSTALGITDTLLPPEKSERLAEVGRKKNLNKVFFTKDRKSAEIYAKKAVRQFGGEPVIFMVRPIGHVDVVQATPGTTVFMADSASIVGQYELNTPTRQLQPLAA